MSQVCDQAEPVAVLHRLTQRRLRGDELEGCLTGDVVRLIDRIGGALNDLARPAQVHDTRWRAGRRQHSPINVFPVPSICLLAMTMQPSRVIIWIHLQAPHSQTSEIVSRGKTRKPRNESAAITSQDRTHARTRRETDTRTRRETDTRTQTREAPLESTTRPAQGHNHPRTHSLPATPRTHTLSA